MRKSPIAVMINMKKRTKVFDLCLFRELTIIEFVTNFNITPRNTDIVMCKGNDWTNLPSILEVEDYLAFILLNQQNLHSIKSANLHK